MFSIQKGRPIQTQIAGQPTRLQPFQFGPQGRALKRRHQISRSDWKGTCRPTVKFGLPSIWQGGLEQGRTHQNHICRDGRPKAPAQRRQRKR